jgi:hypothetical protein
VNRFNLGLAFDGERVSFQPAAPLVDKLEHTFGHSLRHCKFYVLKGGRKPTISFSHGGDVSIAENDLTSKEDIYEAAISHEVCHYLQKNIRNAKNTIGTMSQIELEAELASVHFAFGKKINLSFNDYSTSIRFWDKAGHYYTTVLCYLAAGCDPREASLIGKRAWLPDATLNHAAVNALISAAKENSYRKATEAFLDYKLAKTPEQKTAAIAAGARLGLNETVRAIHMGLHALTSKNVFKEREAREGVILSGRMQNSFLTDIAHHPFGNCYSHMQLPDDDSMCVAGMGHYDATQPEEGHESDQIWNIKRSKPYMDYVGKLYELACRRMKTVYRQETLDNILFAMNPMYHKTRKFALARPVENARKLATLPDCRSEDECANHLQAVALGILGNKKNIYDYSCPEGLKWAQYKNHIEHRDVFPGDDYASSYYLSGNKIFPDGGWERGYDWLGAAILAAACDWAELTGSKIDRSLVVPIYPRLPERDPNAIDLGYGLQYSEIKF